ncbi:MAG: carbamoyl phosphate synthase small subunit [Novosphingobium sp. 17-62-19]|uniref:glutamine-hydrolyzing carbamoyl-phosphate synthase small subunit n=1 Tax=Novosphingobium sp. 17-62-19 TaxID=1970406 RepID=UPI000BD5946D|nr:glutamine-hydrolyzing carbamoyl-phosphate synthase small subunit [Novosphingobium sp. 17-62-19]OYX95321.1 MAG: carbamoyl phosphate synthase small subunit [Novosphingobium sp. 35-62-5]OZA16469.1 MAG: carbamoyl phosphate synthase small subunit [Novosphingobium sp. 17-62-19]HQS98446.1 glutamine-hydrolyzing carbamoyl-phosphate synthase small subunit [Novosphingobium sp.]
MADPALSHAPQPDGATGVLVLADGSVAWGRGFGATGAAVGEVCFNTAMTGYQEVMTDPSYAGQVVTFTFPHIGNVGTNDEDMESHDVPGAVGCVVREDVTAPANFRSAGAFQKWMEKHGKIGISGLDTRALTRRIRMSGAPNAVIAHDPNGAFDIPALVARAREWPGLEGMDLARVVTRESQEAWEGSVWHLGKGFGRSPHDTRKHVVAIDYGAKDNIFRNLVKAGASVTVVPAQTSLETILELKPDGVFLSNGPGDPAATGAYAVPVIQKLLEMDLPVFGICLGHQMLGLAAGARTTKMHQGHRGANHPVKRMEDGVVEITSMNHGFAVDNAPGALGENVIETHVSLFDGSNCGIAVKGKRAFGVQYHPEASPGPQDSFYLFEKFVGMLG